MEERGRDSLFGALADPRRRQVCRSIARADEPVVTLDELASTIGSTGEPDAASSAPDWSPHDVRTTLHHVHLPKLDDADVVEYSPEEQSVRTGATFPLALELVRTVEDATPDADANPSANR